MQPESYKELEVVKKSNKKIFDYSQELVMLNYLFELKMLSKDELLIIKRDIQKSYGISDITIP